MAELIETCRGVVYPWHYDHMNHMNVSLLNVRFREMRPAAPGRERKFKSRHYCRWMIASSGVAAPPSTARTCASMS